MANMPARIGKTDEPVAELTKFGWMIISPGKEDHSNVSLTQSTPHGYEQLYQPNVCGLGYTLDGDKHIVNIKFKEQLQRSTQGWYQTGFPWKPNHLILQINKNGSLARLSTLLSRKKKTCWRHCWESTCNYNIQCVLHPTQTCSEKSGETTKLRIVFDALAKPMKASSSLNECLEVGPALQNTFWNVLIYCRRLKTSLPTDQN